MKFDVTELSKLKKPRTEQNRYSIGRTSALFVLVLLAFYAGTEFPAYYENGPTLQQWGMIVMVMIAGIVTLHFERGCSSKMGKRPHDWNSSAGSLQAFSFVRCSCGKCGSRLVLSYRGDKRIKYITPGAAVPGGESIGFYCPKCAELTPYQKCSFGQFESSAVPRSKIAETARLVSQAKAYRLEKDYIKRYITVTVILLFAEISSFYVARVSAVRLFLPLAVGYFLYVSAFNLVTAVCTRYYVVDPGVVQRVLWGYSVYPLDGKAALVHFSDGEKLAWGLYTDKENLLISPIISDYKAMVSDIKAKCEEKSIPVIS